MEYCFLQTVYPGFHPIHSIFIRGGSCIIYKVFKCSIKQFAIRLSNTKTWNPDLTPEDGWRTLAVGKLADKAAG
jgi:hypothetical protein